MRRAGPLGLAAAGLAATILALSSCAPRDPGRLFVLITIDTLRADVLGAYGHPGATSPALDRFAARAVGLSDCRSVSSWSMAAMGTFATGLRPDD